MARKLLALFVVSTVVLGAAVGVHARALLLEPKKVATIVSPTDERDSRTLVYFELPRELSLQKNKLANAILILKAQVTDADFGALEVFPIGRDWQSAGLVSWGSPWDTPGGDYSADQLGTGVTLKKDAGEKETRLNVTLIVKAWLDGTCANNGLIILTSQGDLQSSSLRCSLNTDGMKLKIVY